MSEIICGNTTCKKQITNKTEVEYSEEFSEFYCNWDCALEALFEKARCAPIDLQDKKQLKEKDVELKKGKFYWRN
ncbi:hypothetical protein [Niallia circulans]|uniref:hypothetical protein n=1 Tax=Niallia circulans TaxID=1397 RepID=UPI0026EED736|nr:hypothetical protein [Niallia circulans]